MYRISINFSIDLHFSLSISCICSIQWVYLLSILHPIETSNYHKVFRLQKIHYNRMGTDRPSLAGINGRACLYRLYSPRIYISTTWTGRKYLCQIFSNCVKIRIQCRVFELKLIWTFCLYWWCLIILFFLRRYLHPAGEKPFLCISSSLP